jgi:hypothetical protein
MLGVAGKIIRLGGEYSKRSLPWTSRYGMAFQAGSRQVWSNTFIDQLATAVKTSGLASDIEEAYLLIVPSLAAHDLLPEVGLLDPKKKEKDGEIREFPPGSSSKRVGSAGPYGERIYNGFSLSFCGEVISRWLEPLFGSERSEEVLDFIFEPDKDLSTSEQEITSVFNKTRAGFRESSLRIQNAAVSFVCLALSCTPTYPLS